MTIEIGNHVRDMVSGIHGYVMLRSEAYSGFAQYGVEPHAEAGKSERPRMLWLDVERVELDPSAPNIVRPPAPAVPNPRFDLGAKLKDTVSGFEGIAVDRIEHFNHCWSYDLTSETKVDRDNKPVVIGVLATRLKVIGKGLVTEREKTKRRSGPSIEGLR